MGGLHARWHDHRRWVAVVGPNQGGGRGSTNENGAGAQPDQGLLDGTNQGGLQVVVVGCIGGGGGMLAAGGGQLTPETPIPHIFQISRSHYNSKLKKNGTSQIFFLCADSQL